MTTSLILPALVLLPLLGAAAVLALRRKTEHALGTLVLAVTAVAFALGIRLAGLAARTEAVSWRLGSLFLSADRVTALLILVFSGLFVLIILFARGLIGHEVDEQFVPKYYAACLAMLSALLAAALAQDLFTMYLLLEVVTACAAVLVAAKGDKPAVEAAVRYIMVNMVCSALLLMGTAGVFRTTGCLLLADIARTLPAALEAHTLPVMASLALIVVGAAGKAALFPLHSWLPQAHGSAATPSSVVISGLLVKVNIVFLFKFFTQAVPADLLRWLPVRPILLVMSVGAIIGGSLMALKQTDIKRMLAYSTVAQVGYIFLGFSLMNETAVVGSLFHILNHAVVKGMLVLAAGSIMKLTGRRRIADFAGVGRRFPLPMVVFAVGSLSMVGIPPLSGFVSKWYLGMGALDAHQPLLIAVLLLSSLLNALYYLPVVIGAFFRSGSNIEQHLELTVGAQAAMVMLAVACILLGLFSSSVIGYIQPAVHRLFVGA